MKKTTCFITAVLMVGLHGWSSLFGQDWETKGQVLIAESGGEQFGGTSIVMPDAHTLAVGIPFNDEKGIDAGQVRVYRWDGNDWVPKGDPLSGSIAGSWYGYALSMPDSNTLAVSAPLPRDRQTEVQVYTWDGSSWVPKGPPLLADTIWEAFGAAVAMPDANTIAISATWASKNGPRAGAVRIYTWNGSTWVKKGEDINGKAYERFGVSLSMPTPNTIAIGVPYNGGAGAVRIYTWNGSEWVQKGNDLVGDAPKDYFGLKISMPNEQTIAIAAPYNDKVENSAGQVRIYTWNGTEWMQKGEDLLGSENNAIAGWSLSMPSPDVVAVGMPKTNDKGPGSGSVHVFQWSGTKWIPRGFKLIGPRSLDQFGYTLVMPDTSTIAVGAPYYDGNTDQPYDNRGLVQVFALKDSVWVQRGSNIEGHQDSDEFGHSVSMPDAQTIAIGAPYNDGNTGNPDDERGSVRIYTWNGATWEQKGGDIDGEAPGDQSGWAVSMPDPNTVAIGAPYNDGRGTDAGHVRVFVWNGTQWIQKGQDIDGEHPGDRSGWAISMPDPNTIAIGTPYNQDNGTVAGHVRIFQWNGYNWVQKGQDIDGGAGYFSGFSVSMPDPNTVAIGAPFADHNGHDAGIVQIYHWNGTQWIQKGTYIGGSSPDDQFGFSVSMPDANTVAIGAIFNDNVNIGPGTGQVSIYQWNGTNWEQKGQDILGKVAWDRAGWSVSMPDANTVAIGARYSDDRGPFSNTGHVRVYRWTGTDWQQKGSIIVGPREGESGAAISMPDSNTIAISAPFGNYNRINGGSVQVYRFGKPLTTDVSKTSKSRAHTVLTTHADAQKIYVTIHTDRHGHATLSLYRIDGRIVAQRSIYLNGKPQTIALPMTNQPKGIYFLQLQGRSGLHVVRPVHW